MRVIIYLLNMLRMAELKISEVTLKYPIDFLRLIICYNKIAQFILSRNEIIFIMMIKLCS